MSLWTLPTLTGLKRGWASPAAQDGMTVLNDIGIHHDDPLDRFNPPDKHVLYATRGNPCLLSLGPSSHPSVSGST